MSKGTPQNLLGERHVIAAVMQDMGKVRERFMDFLSDYGLFGTVANDWRLCFTEAIVNAIKHGCNEDPSEEIDICWYAAEHYIRLEVRDPGKGVDLNDRDVGKVPENIEATHGRGLYLIESFSDRFEAWRSERGFCITIEKSHNELVPPTSPEAILDETINELSSAYENLAAFYRLGDGLVTSDTVADFLDRAKDDMDIVIPNDGIWFSVLPEERLVVGQSKRGKDNIRGYDELGPLQKNVLSRGKEFVWDDQSEVKDDTSLRDYACGACCPINAAGRVHGLITLVRRRNQPIRTNSLNTIRTFADIVGISIINAVNAKVREEEARAYRELEIAADIQNKLLPLPALKPDPRWQLSVHRKSLREVAGDYLDVVHMPDGSLYLAIVDVMGKGVSAAFLAAMFRTAFHLSLDFDYTPQGLMAALNRTLTQQVGDMTIFASCALVRISKDLKNIDVVNAGHCPVIGMAAGKDWQCEPSGPPLGLFEKVDYSCNTYPMLPQQKIVMVTDGLYEWTHEGVIWGWDSLVAYLNSNASHDGESIWDELNGKIDSQVESAESPSDDRAMIYWQMV